MSLSLAMIALQGGGLPPTKDLQRFLQETWRGLPPVSDVQQQDITLSMRIGDADVILGLMPAPLPWSDLEGPCRTSWLWPDAETALRDHDQHLIVTVSSATADALERAKLLSQVAAAILAVSEHAVGVFWGEAALVIPPALFCDFAVQMLPDGLPLYIWIDFRVGRNDDGSAAGFTTGLSAFGHMELETVRSTDEPGELRERLFAIACYLLENGPVLQDGETLGADQHERIRIVHTDSAFGQIGPVIRLDFPRG